MAPDESAPILEEAMAVHCPHCDAVVALDRALTSPFRECPKCAKQFVVPSISTVEGDEAESSRKKRSQDELDAAHIHRMSALRRAAYRSRSYCIIGSVACVVMAAELCFNAWGYWNHRTSMARGMILVLVCVGIAAGLLGVARTLFARAREYGREAAQSSLVEPTTPPDFSTLQDGSQAARNLEEISE